MTAPAIAAHPTWYAGHRFRSRLEARWAAFFDLCKWQWEYEPFDLEGWVPDFLIHGETPLLVEVKPVLTFAGNFDKVTRMRPREVPLGAELLCVGVNLFDYNTCKCYPEGRNCCGVYCIGWLGERGFDEKGERAFLWSEAALIPGLPIEVRSALYDYTGRITGYYEGGNCGGVGCCEAKNMWGEAGAMVQWRGREVRRSA